MWYHFPCMEGNAQNSIAIGSVCFTGHRDIPGRATAAYRQLVAHTAVAVHEAVQRGARRFYCGGAAGFDLLAGRLVLLERDRRGDVQLFLVLPYTGFGDRFSEEDRTELQRLKRDAEEVVYLSSHYFPGCMAIRNRQLVANADLCIAYLTRSPSGTAQTVGYARGKGIEVVYV